MHIRETHTQTAWAVFKMTWQLLSNTAITLQVHSVFSIRIFVRNTFFFNQTWEMDWNNARVIRAENKYHRWTREAIESRKRANRSVNPDEEAFILSHTWDVVLEKTSDSRGRKLFLLSDNLSRLYTRHNTVTWCFWRRLQEVAKTSGASKLILSSVWSFFFFFTNSHHHTWVEYWCLLVLKKKIKRQFPTDPKTQLFTV